MIGKSLFNRATLLLALILLRPETAQACAVCFGKSDSAMAKGMNMGIFTLLFFIGSTLATLACFFIFLAMRASRSSQNGAMAAINSPDNPAHS